MKIFVNVILIFTLQTEKVREIRKQEVQLEVYIQESQELCNVREEKPQPLRTACSEMFLLDPSIQDQDFSQKTTSLLDIQVLTLLYK
jgi:hypothetical protein